MYSPFVFLWINPRLSATNIFLSRVRDILPVREIVLRTWQKIFINITIVTAVYATSGSNIRFYYVAFFRKISFVIGGLQMLYISSVLLQCIFYILLGIVSFPRLSVFLLRSQQPFQRRQEHGCERDTWATDLLTRISCSPVRCDFVFNTLQFNFKIRVNLVMVSFLLSFSCLSTKSCPLIQKCSISLQWMSIFFPCMFGRPSRCDLLWTCLACANYAWL
jgi:hypothetical protein